MAKYRPRYSGLNTLNGTNIHPRPISSKGGEAGGETLWHSGGNDARPINKVPWGGELVVGVTIRGSVV